MKEEDWCVKMTPENRSVIIDWGGTMGWSGTSQHYGMEDGRKAAHWSVWGKLLTTEEFYQKIGYQPKGTTQFEVGKWYKTLDHPYYGKFSKIGERNTFHVTEGVVGTYLKNYYFEPGYNWVPLTDLSEIQQYLPEGHVDKIKVEVIPEYVELLPGWSTPFTGRIFKTDKYIKEDYWPTASSWNDILKDSLHKKYFKPSTKEAFEAQNKPKEPRTEVLTEGDYYTIENYYLGDTNHVMIGKVIVGNNGDNNYGNLRGIAAYLATHDQSFRKNDTWCYKDTSGRTPRKSTFSERQWLDVCIKANKFIPKEEALKPEEKWTPGMGDWVTVTKWHHAQIELPQTCEVVSIDGDNWFHIRLNRDHYGHKKPWSFKHDEFRQATPEEIAKVTGKKEDLSSKRDQLLAEAKLKYAVGSVIEPIGSNVGGNFKYEVRFTNCTYYADNDTFYVDGNLLLYQGGTWAKTKFNPTLKETPMEKLYAVGTRVKLKEGNEYMYQSNGTEGTITRNDNGGDHIYSITWDNKNENAYRHSDLEPVHTAGVVSTNKVQPVLIKETPIKNPGTLRHQRAVILH